MKVYRIGHHLHGRNWHSAFYNPLSALPWALDNTSSHFFFPLEDHNVAALSTDPFHWEVTPQQCGAHIGRTQTHILITSFLVRPSNLVSYPQVLFPNQGSWG